MDCEEVVEGVKCCESLREGVGTYGDGIRFVGLLSLNLELIFGGYRVDLMERKVFRRERESFDKHILTV